MELILLKMNLELCAKQELLWSPRFNSILRNPQETTIINHPAEPKNMQAEKAAEQTRGPRGLKQASSWFPESSSSTSV